MATTFDFVISCHESQMRLAEFELQEALSEVANLEQALSEYNNFNSLWVFHAAEVGAVVRLDPEVVALLKLSETLELKTRGAFSPYAKGNGRPIWVNSDSIKKTGANNRITFGAIGKGYALDRAATRIALAGFENFLLSAGGSSQILNGFSSPGMSWKLGWSWKVSEVGELEGASWEHSSGRWLALGISGKQEKGNHILDSRSADSSKRTDDQVLSAMVAHSSATQADALSTALFVAGPNDFSTCFKEGEVPGWATIDPENVPRWNRAFMNWFGASTIVNALTLTAAHSEETVDLAELEQSSEPAFNPFPIERNLKWMGVPVVALVFVLYHLKKTKRKRERLNERT